MRACYAEGRRTRRWAPNLRLLPADEPAGADGLSSVVDRDQLERGFRRLSIDHRAVVVLHHYLDLPLDEVAETLGVPVGTVRSRLHHAMRGLRAALDADARPTAREACPMSTDRDINPHRSVVAGGGRHGAPGPRPGRRARPSPRDPTAPCLVAGAEVPNEMNTPLKLAIAATAAAVVVAAAIGINVMTGAGGVGGSPAVVAPSAVSTPTPTPTVTPTPTFTPRPAPTETAPTPEPSQVDLGWPGSPGSPAGRYSWDPDVLGHVFGQQAPKDSVSSWMHKPDSHIELRMTGFETDFGPGPTAATVGGYDATYQEARVNSDADGGKRQVWIVDIDGKGVTIIVDSGRDASGADLAEARAVIDSIRVERTDSKTGFKLTFDLLAGWDSE